MTARQVALTIDGKPVSVPEGSTLREACDAQGIDTPTLCWAANLSPVNVCRICVVELEGARALAPACSRKVEAGMVVKTDSERVRTARRLVLELLGSSVDLSASKAFQGYVQRYAARPERFGPKAPPAAAGSHPADGQAAATVAAPAKVDNDLYVFDSSRCILCYRCVEACGTDAQHTFAISAAGRGFEARISTEFAVPYPESACVFCGNCVGACPTSALMFRSEFELRQAGAWDEAKQTVTDTICPYCGVGCTLSLRVQDNRIVQVKSPTDNAITRGHLCVKGRFGFEFVQNR